MSRPQEICLAKVVIIGDSGVGKTNLMTKYCQGVFKESYVATIGVDFKLKDIRVSDLLIRLQIWDTAGQERFRNITQAYFKGAKGIILAFDLTQPDSFKNLGSWMRQIDTVSSETLVKMLVGTKLDLKEERTVSEGLAKEFADKYGMMYCEVSSKQGVNVQQTFRRLAEGIKNNYDKEAPDDSLSVVIRRVLEQSDKGTCGC